MAEAISSLVSDTETSVVQTAHVVIYAPKRNRQRLAASLENEISVQANVSEANVKQSGRSQTRPRSRFPENCVTVHASEADARAAARPEDGYFAAVASGPSRSSEGFRLYYLMRWLD